MAEINLKKPVADICLLLEGTYPYVSGGVSTWVHNLIKALPMFSFCGVIILPNKDKKRKPKYEIPKNLVKLDHIYIHDYKLSRQRKAISRKKRAVDDIYKFHQAIKEKKDEAVDVLLDILYPKANRRISFHEMIYSKPAWDMMLKLYESGSSKESFIDFFWTYRFCHLPLLQVLDFDAPAAKVYHSVSTGYAGLLGAVASKRTGRPLMLTEHGIYTKERKIEIAQAEWIYQSKTESIRAQKELSAFQRKWVAIFEGMSRMAYYTASEIITLYEGNRRVQISEGCPIEKTSIIPNGINLDKFAGLKKNQREPGASVQIGFVGRIVPIKDVKTFIRACKLISLKKTNIEFYIIGPTDEDKEYFKECLMLTKTLGLKDIVHFTGKVNMLDFYKRLDLVVLTSISEAQPLVILEANCAGIPAVSSDVGACSEMINGRTEEDQKLGPSGLVTTVADPKATADAILTIINDDNLRTQMIEAGQTRIRRYYNETDLNNRYKKIYKGWIDSPAKDI